MKSRKWRNSDKQAAHFYYRDWAQATQINDNFLFHTQLRYRMTKLMHERQ